MLTVSRNLYAIDFIVIDRISETTFCSTASKLTSGVSVTARPRISLHPGPLYVKEGNNVTLPSCHVTGYPKPAVGWRRASAPLPHGRTSVNGSSLLIRSAQKDDTDTYFCQASNLLGSTSATTFLVVVSLPRFTHKPPAKIVTFTGKTMTLNCSAEGDPQPVISWRREGGQLPRDRTVMTDGSLTIKDLRKEDEGVYVCVATSSAVSDVEAQTTVVLRKYTSDAVRPLVFNLLCVLLR